MGCGRAGAGISRAMRSRSRLFGFMFPVTVTLRLAAVVQREHAVIARQQAGPRLEFMAGLVGVRLGCEGAGPCGERQQETPARAKATASVTPSGDTLPPDLADWLGEEGEIDAQAILEDLKAGASRWLGEFNEDLKDTKPSTLLLVFGLGVMVGKMTA